MVTCTDQHRICKKATQCDRLSTHLLFYGSITSVEAWTELGIWRCASRIHDLKKMGADIETRMITVINRFGEKCKVARYEISN